MLVLGDFHFGESYADHIGESSIVQGARTLQEHGYSHSTERLRPFVEASDAFIVNLETPLVDPVSVPSPLHDQKTYVHQSDPEKTVAELQNLGVTAVGLANNHTLDYGPEGLESTFGNLADARIDWFGAGRSIDEARAPFRVSLPERMGGGEIHFHGSFQYSHRYDADYGFYADNESAGCAPLSVSDVPQARDSATAKDTFQVAFPHWGANYQWRGQGQYRLAHRFLNKDYDLVLGHGGHTLQEVHRKQQRWVVYGIGNGIFNAGGRGQMPQEDNGILPLSFWTMIEVHQEDARRWMSLKLYPVYSDNQSTGFQPGPVSSEDFSRIIETLASRPARPWRFDNPARGTGNDDLGHFLTLDLGEWVPGERPSRLKAPTESGDPGDWPLRSPNPKLEERIWHSGRGTNSCSLTRSAEAEGGKVRWFGRLGLIEAHKKRLLVWDYRLHESALGAAIVSDKALTAELLEEADVPSPKSVVVHSSDEAVRAAATMSGPVAVKPQSGSKGRGVSTDLVGDEEIRQAFAFAHEHSPEVLIQQSIKVREELRVMASPERVVAVVRRVAPNVIGDGTSTIAQLVEDKNLQRQLNPSLKNRPIPMDALTYRQLERNGLSPGSVLAVGETITVRNVAGLSAGADAIQALEETAPHIKKVSSAAIAAIPGLGWGVSISS